MISIKKQRVTITLDKVNLALLQKLNKYNLSLSQQIEILIKNYVDKNIEELRKEAHKQQLINEFGSIERATELAKTKWTI